MSDFQSGPSEQPYGQQAGQQPEQHPYAPPPPPGYGAPPSRRPGTVTGAAVITLVMAGLSAFVFGLAGVLFLAAPRSQIVEELERQSDAMDGVGSLEDEMGMPLDAFVGVLGGTMLVLAVVCLIGVLLGALAFKRSNAVRVVLTVWCALIALLSLVTIFSLVSAISLVAAVAVIVLLFSRSAREWYADTAQAPAYAQHGQQPPGSQPPTGPQNPYGQG